MTETPKIAEITMTTIQKVDQERDTTIYRYRGSMMLRGGRYFLTYQEKMDEEQQETKTLLVAAPRYMTMSCSGARRQKMEFDPGRRTRAVYETSMGSLPMEIETKYYELTGDAEGIEMKLCYELYSKDLLLSGNELKIMARMIG